MPPRPPLTSRDACSEDPSGGQPDQTVYQHFDGYDRGPSWPVGDYGEQGIFTAAQELELASKRNLSPEIVSRLSLYVANALDTESVMNMNRVSRDKAVKTAEVALRQAVRSARQDEVDQAKLVEVLLRCTGFFAESRTDLALLDAAQSCAGDPESTLEDLLKATATILACPGSAAILAPADQRRVYDGRREHIVRSCCYVWLDAGRRLTYAMDKGRREGPLFELVWMVMRMVLPEGHYPSDEAIRRDIDRFRDLAKRRPEILDQR